MISHATCVNVHASVFGESTSQVNGTRFRRRGRGNPEVLCVSMRVWSTDHDGEDVDETILWYIVCLCRCGQQTRTEKTWTRESCATVCDCAGVVNRLGRRRRGRRNPVVHCVSVQVWSTDKDGEDVGASESSGTVCLCRCGQQTVSHRAQKT